jgi:hypothetical protein
MTDEYDIYAKLPAWATATKRSAIAKARTRATKTAKAFVKFTSIPSRDSGLYSAPGYALIGVSHKSCCLFYLGFFEYVHNVRKRRKALLGSLLALLLT